ncbi:ABC transporter substrate-binding protein [Allorhizobium undicola]|uniref:ABC transporter substrate-binding protein n=1 Tax=Allorhizobium undicola TaxID=78527 RepID=UPI0009FC9A26|nr:ABC transporter substrate-binding protein [Allorhizobium undicola]
MLKTLGRTATALFLTLAASGAIAPARAEPDRIVDIAAPFEITGLDPAKSGEIFLRMNIVETLVDVDGQGKAIPGLARDWQVSPDGLVWRFRLRDNVRFHDATTMTAKSVASALTIARTKPGLLARAPIATITAEGDALVVITLTRPFTPLAAFLAEARAQILAPASYEGNEVTAIIGTGPFRLTKIEAPQSLSVTRFGDYWGEEPAIENARYLSVGRAETRALMAESGDADYVFNLDPASRTRLGKSAAVKLLSVPIPRSLLLKVNAGNPLLADLRARQALSLAIDREGLAAAILRYPAAATQLFPPSLGGWHEADLPPLASDPQKARALLAELGWKPGDDGILQKDGKRFSLMLTTYPDRPELPLTAAVLQEQFREIGVELTIDSTNSSEIPVRHQDGTLALALMARNFALAPDPLATMLGDYGPKGGDWGSMNWSNTSFDAALDGLSRSSDAQEAQALRQKVVSIIQQELPVIPVAWYQQSVAVSNRLENAQIDPYERSFGLKSMRWAP